MIKLNPNEKLITSFHRHWIVIAGKMTTIAAMLLIPLIALIILNVFASNAAALLPLILYLLIVYLLVIALVAFVFWIDYYLDAWVITNQRIIDIEQKGMFRREVSEFMFYRIQDITVEIPSFTATLLKYGNVVVHTAGEKSFHINQIPNVRGIKDLVLEQVRKTREKELGK